MNKVYINEKQLQFHLSDKKKKVFIGGRGSGKSTVLGDEIYQCVTTMPRSRGFLAANIEETIVNYSLPSILERWEMFGLIEEVDFVVNKRPPVNWPKPYNPPKKYNKTITFSNGSVINIISMYGKNAGRGGNFQWGFFDEAALIDKETHDKAVKASVRGALHKVAKIPIDKPFEPEYGEIIKKNGRWFWRIPFRDNPRYMMTGYVSTMPWLSSGQWLLKFEDQEDVSFVESTAWDNIEVLGSEYIHNLKSDLPPHIYDTEVMNKRVSKVENGFYSDFDDDVHTVPESMYNPHKELEISLDFNAGFNSMIVCQSFDKYAYVHDELYVKGNLIVDDLIDEFIEKYQNHPVKRVDIYGDRNGNNKQANARKTIYESIESILRNAGWEIYRPGKGLDAPHEAKHQLINKAFREKNTNLPAVRMNRQNCRGLSISIMKAAMTHDFKKDKRSERRLTENREEATDLSDCFDNWYYFRYKHLSNAHNAGTAVGIFT